VGPQPTQVSNGRLGRIARPPALSGKLVFGIFAALAEFERE
jgi:DNA invertase Pin-like site-specific DNA recombinase